MTATKLALMAALLIGFGAPALAKAPNRSATAAQASTRAAAPATTRTRDVHSYDGRYVGADPDPSVRSELLRDSASSSAGGM